MHSIIWRVRSVNDKMIQVVEKNTIFPKIIPDKLINYHLFCNQIHFDIYEKNM